MAYRNLLREIRGLEARAVIGGIEGEELLARTPNHPEAEADDARERAIGLLRNLDQFDLSDAQRTYLTLRFFDPSGKIPTNEQLEAPMNAAFPDRDPPFTAENLRRWFWKIKIDLRQQLNRFLNGE